MSIFNSITVIQPFKEMDTWVFDDHEHGLIREPFVSGMPKIIEKMIEIDSIPHAESGFTALFSNKRFPGANHILKWIHTEYSGNWYELIGSDLKGWLCPSLFEYFDNAPKEIFVQAMEAKEVEHD